MGSVARRVSRLLTDYTFGLTLMAYLAVGVGGFVSVVGTPPPNVLDGFNASPAIVIAQLALICALAISYPLMFVVARIHFFSLTAVWLDADRHHAAVTVVGVFLSLTIAVAFPAVENVLGLLGATSSVSLSFVIPALLYDRHVLQSTAPHPSQWASWVPKVLMGFGLVLAALAIPVQIYEMSQYRVAPSSSQVFAAHSVEAHLPHMSSSDIPVETAAGHSTPNSERCHSPAHTRANRASAVSVLV